MTTKRLRSLVACDRKSHALWGPPTRSGCTHCHTWGRSRHVCFAFFPPLPFPRSSGIRGRSFGSSGREAVPVRAARLIPRGSQPPAAIYLPPRVHQARAGSSRRSYLHVNDGTAASWLVIGFRLRAPLREHLERPLRGWHRRLALTPSEACHAVLLEGSKTNTGDVRRRVGSWRTHEAGNAKRAARLVSLYSPYQSEDTQNRVKKIRKMSIVNIL